MPDTMDTSLTSRARRVAAQWPRARPVPIGECYTGRDPSYLEKKYDLQYLVSRLLRLSGHLSSESFLEARGRPPSSIECATACLSHGAQQTR